QALSALGVVESRHILGDPSRRTPTYTKPMLLEDGRPGRELNRLDIKNRMPLPTVMESRVVAAMKELWQQVDGLLVLDQGSETDCGVVTTRVRQVLAELGEANPGKFILADSRERVGLFRSVWLKPNSAECERAVGEAGPGSDTTLKLAQLTGRPVFCTLGEKGICVVAPRPGSSSPTHVPAYPVTGPVDIVGAGDSTSAGIACAVAAGTSLPDAA